jgi:hypothetical protein
MDASQLFGTIIRILNQPVFPPRRKAAHAHGRHALARPVARHPEPRMAAPVLPAPTLRHAVPSAPAPLPAPAVVTTQAMRTLEEVRADLARLRAHAKRRHLDNAQARRDLSFAPTDFMDFGVHPQASAASPATAGFPPTDFLDLRVIKPS